MYQNESNEVAVFRKMSGENDQPITYNNNLGDVPLYVSNMERGDYSVYRWPSFGGNDRGLGIQQTWNEDPYLGQLNRTHEFRQAISYALDRAAINDTVFLGLGAVQNFVPRPDSPWYPGDEVRDLFHATERGGVESLARRPGTVGEGRRGFQAEAGRRPAHAPVHRQYG